MTGTLMRFAIRIGRPIIAIAGALALVPSAALARDGASVATVAPAGDAAPAAASADPGVVEKGQPGAGRLTVLVDRAKVIRLPARTQTVVVGNPAIADMAVQKNGVVVVTGKSYGSTNLIALDGTGNVLAESVVDVSAPADATVLVQRGLERQSYACNPNCLPSVVLGDSNTFFTETRGQADARNQFATSR